NEEIDNLHDSDRVSFGGSIFGKARDIVERIHLEGAKSLAQAESEFYAGHALITNNSFGHGAASYLAARFELPALLLFYKKIKKELNLFSGLQNEIPEGVVFRRRQSSKGVVGFLFNYSRETKVIDLSKFIHIGGSNSGSYKMKPYESLVLRNQ
ncbi:MAG: beta-galactosidase trimerization domain-containing protein, partial [Verrucomicrobiota bacterium]|nr:beta-galactosidase trimerization domain-containing protein [Verrucomicrobiota bacterium]